MPWNRAWGAAADAGRSKFLAFGDPRTTSRASSPAPVAASVESCSSLSLASISIVKCTGESGVRHSRGIQLDRTRAIAQDKLCRAASFKGAGEA